MNQARRFCSSSVPASRTSGVGHAILGLLLVVLGALVLCPVALAQPSGVAASPGPVWSWGGNSYGQLGIGNENSSDVPVAGPSEGFSDISAGGFHTLALDSNGDVWAWGQGTYGQLGDGPSSGTPVTSEYPIDITADQDTMGPVQQVAAGGYFSLALDQNGNVWAWGYNNADQVGQNSSDVTQETTPTEVSDISNVVQVAAGQQFSLALRSDGTVWAWGVNAQGQLGNGGTTNEYVPQEVAAPGSTCNEMTGSGCLTNVVAVAAAGWTAYALEADGNVVAWGRGAEDELGNDTSVTTQDIPVGVWAPGSTGCTLSTGVGCLSGITSIAGGGYHALAVGSGGEVYAWGDNSNGQLGNNSLTSSDIPVAVDGVGGSGNLSGVQSVTAGSYYSLALTETGSVDAWGQNSSGQLGNGNTTQEETPVAVASIGVNDGAAALSAGEGTLGTQSFIIGQPAVSLTTSQGVTLSQVEFAPSVVGQASSSSAVTITDTGDAPLDINFTDLIGQDADSFTISGDSCSGTTLQPEGTASADLTSCTIGIRENPAVAGPLSASLQISTNLTSLYADLPLSGAGLPTPTSGLSFSTSPASLFATGSDSNGQLGAGDTGATYVSTPTGLQPSSASFVQASAGGTHSLGLKPDGTVWAWGANSYGQLGNNSTTDSWTLSQVPLPTAAVAVSSGQNHSLAIDSNGNVWAWGENQDGQLGNGNNTGPDTCTVSNTACGLTPAQVPGISNIVAVSAGGTHSLALQANGTVWAWGNNGNSQLGNGNTTQQDSPVQVTGLPSNIVAVSAGSSYSLALTSTGAIYSWGANTNGQLGNGNTTQEDSPVEVSSISTAVGIAAGGNFGLALLANGTVDSWGANGYGQLGNGNTTQQDSPVAVSTLTGVTRIAAGAVHAAAINTSGQAYAWGYNSNGQLGNGNTTSEDTPVQMSSIANGAAGLGIGSSANHTLVIGQPYATLSATTLTFSTESVGTPAPALNETVTNNGTTPLQITTDTIYGGDGDQFKITGDGCAATTVAPGGNCVIGVRYEPIISGTPAATLRINSNTPGGQSLVALDPPDAKPATHRKLTCHATKAAQRSLHVTCTRTPEFTRTGSARVILMLGRRAMERATGYIFNHQLTVTFNVSPSQLRKYNLVVGSVRSPDRDRIQP